MERLVIIKRVYPLRGLGKAMGLVRAGNAPILTMRRAVWS